MVLVHSSTSYSYVMVGDNYIVILIDNYIIFINTISNLVYDLQLILGEIIKYCNTNLDS